MLPWQELRIIPHYVLKAVIESSVLGRKAAFPTSRKREESLPFGQSREFWVNIVLKRLRTTAFIKMFHGVLLPLVIVKKSRLLCA